jgi:hypothetical protein
MIRWGQKGVSLLEIGGLLFFGLCFAVFMNVLENHSIQQKLVLEIAATELTTFQIFWRKSGEHYTPGNSRAVQIGPSQSEYQIALPELVGVDFLRFDPLDKPASLHIMAARLLLPREVVLDVLPSLGAKAGKFNEMTLARDGKNGALHILSSGSDPNFEVEIDSLQFWYFNWKYNVAGLAGFVLLFGLLLRQDLLKGSRKKGVLALSLPQEVLPNLAAVDNDSGFVGVWREKRNNTIFYWLDIKGGEDRSLADLVERLKQDNPEARIRFQYNRSGNV